MVGQNVRKLQDQFIATQGLTDLEEQILKYASEFKEKDYSRRQINILVKHRRSQMNFGCGKLKRENQEMIKWLIQ
ncbi:unnamed protein product [Paramecium sonneborni]|uniref:Uncharacterized protein n=1 Tax=Paramecium sonneborni TaxID=65129 RepID=A0A8S1QUD1_9CILI|nr:unnamed protein product [Paramecium sonneborni]